MPITFISQLETRTVHNPYATAMPTLQIMEPLADCTDSHFHQKSGFHPTLTQVPYLRCGSSLPRRVLCGYSCVEAFSQLIRLRLGGICFDLRPMEIANVIYETSGVLVAGVDIFTNNKGCCSVWVRSEREADLVRSTMHHRVWMAPFATGFALRAKNAGSAEFLEEEVRNVVHAPGEHFPRHLVTVEKYVVRPPQNK